MNTNYNYYEGFLFFRLTEVTRYRLRRYFVIEIYTVYLLEDNAVEKNEKFDRLNI